MDATRVQKIHHSKEIFARILIGYLAGKALTLYLFGPKDMDKPLYGFEANQNIDDLPDDETSLEYSTALVKKKSTLK